jgi:hypothetical protein
LYKILLRLRNGEREDRMRKSEEASEWVVYQMAIPMKPYEINVVCEQCEWDVMEMKYPGRHKLVRSGITNEGEAERLARGTSGDPRIRLARRL